MSSKLETAATVSERLLTNCSQIVTLSGPSRPRVGAEMRELSIVRDGAILMHFGRIVAVGPRSEVEPLASRDAEIVDAAGQVVTPGFVDGHTHLIFAGNRADEFELRCAGMTYQQISEQGGGIRSTVRKTRTATEGELVDTGRKHAQWFLRNGTTTVEAKSGYGLTLESELKILRAVRSVSEQTPLRCVPTFLGAHEVPEEYSSDYHYEGPSYVELIIREMLPAVAQQRLARYCDVFCEPKVFSVGMARQILTAAKALGLELRVHADQFTCSGAALLAAELGAKTADHLEQSDSVSIAALKAAGVQPVLLPGSVYAIGSQKYAPARAMIEAGLAVVLATDFNPGSSPTASMPMVMSLACTQMKMTPAEALTAATINAACSLDVQHDVGSLDVGKVADIVVHEAEDYREIPYWFGGQRPAVVLVGGERLAQA
ncbi:Imidazolonepropionase [Acidisarcina polymorpha]|uniref:Imidazolonepropionase n=1 Tax=Acidisarcina polymorpha TaxID=2211140 RepID=A0A2Z5FY70_9BACT|nr:imidazolonepropionase [Acidisarcina polymorpha]AXC11829.1 Imidazolonepropionase [Acidisarcina polymorpha]